MHNEYRKLVIGFDALPFNSDGIINAEVNLIKAGFSIVHSSQNRELTVSFTNKKELETIADILKI